MSTPRLDLRIRRSDINPGQWKLLQSREPVVLMSGGFGSGKTTALALKLLELKAANPHTPGLLISQTWRALWSITFRRLMTTLRQVLPRDQWPAVKDKTGECYLDFGDGVPIFLRSGANPDSIDGLDVGYLLGDELRHWPKHSYEVALGRVRVPCPAPQSVFGSTPEMNWMAEEFDTGRSNRRLIVAPTFENERNLAPGFIKNLRLSYSKRLQKAVIDGIFTILEGAVYDCLDPDIWNSEWVMDWEYDPSRRTYLAVDPGYVRSSWLFIQEVSPLAWVVFDELMLDSCSDYNAVERVNAKGYQIDEIWCDPAADNTQSSFGIDTIAIMKSIKARCRTPIRYISGPFRDIAFGVDKVRTMFGDPEAGLPIRIKFAKSLRAYEAGRPRGVVRDVLSYRYPEIRDGRPIVNVPLKDGLSDHSCDSLRYFTVGMWTSTKLRSIDRRVQEMAKRGGGFRIAA